LGKSEITEYHRSDFFVFPQQASRNITGAVTENGSTNEKYACEEKFNIL
jgi:hypothetical protein